jgi:hypothetical protein
VISKRVSKEAARHAHLIVDTAFRLHELAPELVIIERRQMRMGL